MSLTLLPGLELANVESASTEWSLGRLHPRSLSVFDTLEADKAEAKHVGGAVGRILGRTSRRALASHQLDIGDLSEYLEELGQLTLCLLHRHKWIDWKAPEVQVLSSHLLFEFEGSHADVSFAKLLFQSRHDIELGSCRDQLVDRMIFSFDAARVVKLS